MHRVSFISLEEDDKDLIVSFVLEDAELGFRSLLLHRTLFFEELLDDHERGVNVSYSGVNEETDDLDMLERIDIGEEEIDIKSNSNEYNLNIAKIERSVIIEMLELLKKQNHDNKFIIHVA